MAYLGLTGVILPGLDGIDRNITGMHVSVTSLGVYLYGTSGINGGLISYALTQGQIAVLAGSVVYDETTTIFAVSDLSFLELNNVEYAITGLDASGNLIAYALEEDGSATVPVLLPGDGSSADFAALTEGAVPVQASYYYAVSASGDEIQVFEIGTEITARPELSISDTEDSYGTNITDMLRISVGGNSFLLVTSAGENGISIYSIDDATGALSLSDTVGAALELGINTPLAMELLEVGSASYVIVASALSNSLSVLRVEENGILNVTDHIIDTSHTRFQNASVIETFTIGDRGFVLAGGGDDGISLFTILPDGTLLHLESIADELNTTLENIASISAVVLGDEVQVFVTSGNEAGVTQFSLSAVNYGDVIYGTALQDSITGTSGDDLIYGGPGDDDIYGGDGADILYDGSGSDVLWGGAGADIFVFEADGVTDTIQDFEPGVDRLDLSHFNWLYYIGQISYVVEAWGITLNFNDEQIHVRTLNQTSITIDDVFGDSFTDPNRPVLIGTNEQIGSDADDILIGGDQGDTMFGGAGNDVLVGGGGADVLNGGTGVDRAQYLGASAVIADLLNSSNNTGVASGDTYISIERLYGTAFGDGLYGDHANNAIWGHKGNDFLSGRGGNDALYGGGGNDVLVGGSGGDVLNGGTGYDRAQYLGGSRVTADLLNSSNNRGNAIGDTYISIERLYGSAFNDSLLGDHANNAIWGHYGADDLFGRGGNDALYGGVGADDLYGGAGNDLLSGGGGADKFVFFANSGDDKIVDFQNNYDKINLKISGLTLEDLTLTYANGDTTIDYGSGTITVENTTITAVSDDIVFL
ncbi:M10 family metallopeptidase C-terminal domain-containing protein [Thalassobius sp. I31.1]|uniref:M10 family metallopeptidase C-terminal domain-containing protein n=1 Tax=Thalassobius sp. I31.1 TaxID=2109912 RepID=UPI000D1B429F|nr:M10 family metallopeptidase C-terminal domain-containing protein [Thalassobius sp. I31.1]